MIRGAFLIVTWVLAGCTGSLPQSGKLPTIDGTEVANVNAASVGGITAPTITSVIAQMNSATETNAASMMVRRDASGNFSAGTITAALNGHATSATEATHAIWADGKAGADLPSTATLNLGTDGNFFQVTGTTNVSALSSRPAGTRVTLRLATGAAFTFIHSGNFILRGRGNFKAVSSDIFEFVAVSPTAWQEISRSAALDSGVAMANLASTTIPANGIYNAIPFTTFGFDTQGEWANDTFTAHQSGQYQVQAGYLTSSIAWAANGSCKIAIGSSSGASYAAQTLMFGMTSPCSVSTAATIYMLPGHTLIVGASVTNQITIAPDGAFSYVRITRIGP